MTISRSDGPPNFGSPPPRYASFPSFEKSLGPEFIEVAELAGLQPDAWQKFVVYNSMGIDEFGKLATPEVGVCVSRQNGKGGILEIITLGRLFVLGSPLTLHSAHLYSTSQDAMWRLETLIRNTPELHEQVKSYIHSHGEQGIELHSGPILKYVARSKGGGRGRSAECLFLDESMFLPDEVMTALIPTGSAKEYRQIWYTGSAVDQITMPDGLTMARVRERGIKGDPGLAYFEWAPDIASPDDVTEEMAADRRLWAESNPAYGIRIHDDSILIDKGSLPPRGFAVERLNIGDWPVLDGSDSIIDLQKWASLVDLHSKIVQKTIFVFDVSPSRAQAAIVAAGLRDDGLRHIETVETGSGTGWIIPKLKDLQERHRPVAILCDSVGPAASLVPELEQAGVEITTVNSTEHGQACGMLFDAVDQATLRHLGTPEMTSAIKGAAQRPLGEAWAWSRKNSSVDITPLVAATLAHWAISKHVEGEILVAYR